ncbi:MFS transporter [Streptomyces sp. 8L]|uniref:MFS transporter n=1 Tax=Streptomyces sp. 8L TaxID=2877242 RepID=UPI001CD6EF50|nr:MFS transporter [Streptomyces sp. 8L]MCA1222675.1 MFS transporter [Streptomyces sp. 8L]
MTTARKWAGFLILSMSCGIVYQVAYIRFVYLGPTAQALHLSAQDYGNVISVFGVVATVMYFLGGWFADRFPPRGLIVTSLAGTGVADLYLSTVPGYWGTVAAHVVMAVMGMGLYWSALVKAIGMLGDASEQGRIFGFLEGARGVTSTVVGFAGTAVVGAAAAESAGVLWLIRIYGILAFVFAALVLLFVRVDRTRLAALGSSTVTLRQLLSAAKNAYTWLIGLTIMLMYCFYTTLGYFSPLLEYRYGVAAGLIGAIGVVRTYVFQFVAGPAGGVVADKAARSAPRFLRWMFAAASAVALVFLLMPRDPAFLWVAVALMFVLCLMVFASRGVYWAQVSEVEIEESERGGVIGLASGLAYLPDAFLPSLCAWWVGDPSARPAVPEHGGGYSALFVFLLVMGLLGLVLTTLTRRVRTRDLAARAAGHAPAAHRALAPGGGIRSRPAGS